MKLFKSKRGISPLIATIMLILFSIGLGAVVMSWGEAYIEQKAEFVQGVQETFTGCESAEFSIVHIAGQPQICLRGSMVEMIIDNGPMLDLADIHARVVGTKDVYTRESILDAPMPRASSKKIMFSIGDIGEIRQIKLTPQVLMGDTVTMCPQGTLLIEGLNPCP